MADLSADRRRLLSDYLEQALDLDESARPAWLAALGERDAAMAEQVAKVLAVREQAGFANFLAGPSPLFETDSGHSSHVGRVVGPYVIDAEVGRGGMGNVWRARRADGRYEGTVAIKFLHATWIGRAGAERFRVEGNLLGRLEHPHIARLLDAGVLEGSQPYLILEFVDGEPIDAYCLRNALGAEARIELFLDVLAAVGHAHTHLIVHRDIKPANVFVTREGVVKLLDFGIAKLMDDEARSGELTHAEGATPLTPQFAAPEQLLGEPVSTATDVYALGLVLYILLTGAHPIAADSRSNAGLINSMISEIPPYASKVASIATVSSRSLQGDLDNILHKALKKEPAERYSSAGAFADDLRRFLTHQPVYARADTLSYRTRKFVRRHRGGVMAALLSTMALIFGLAGTIWEAHRAAVNAATADRARVRALEQLKYAEASNELLSFLLEAGSDKPFTTPELLARGEGIVNGQFTDAPALRASLLLTLADMYAEVEDKSQALSLFIAAQSAAQKAQDESLLIEIDCGLGLEYADQDDSDRSLSLLNTAIARAGKIPDLDRKIVASCLNNRSQVQRDRGNPSAALVDAMAAVAALGTPRPGQRTLELNVRTTLARASADLGNHAVAVQAYGQAINDLERIGWGQTSFAVTLLNEFGIMLSRSGQWLRAADVYERALSIARDVSGNGEISPMAQVNYGKLLIDLGREREALTQFDAALVSAKRRGDARAIDMVDLLSAPAWCKLGNLDECAVRLERSGRSLHDRLPPGHTTLATYETELAQLAVDRGQLDMAQQHLRDALGIFAAAEERSPNELRALCMETQVDLMLGDPASAASHAREVVAKARSALGGISSSAWLGCALLVQGEVSRAQGNMLEARTALAQAYEVLRSAAGDRAPWTQQAQAELARQPE